MAGRRDALQRLKIGNTRRKRSLAVAVFKNGLLGFVRIDFRFSHANRPLF